MQTEPIPGGEGWFIDPESLLPLVSDEAAFREAHAEDPALEGLVLLWTGHPEGALGYFTNETDGIGPVRRQALTLDCWRDLGHHAEAVAGYRELLAQVDGTPAEVEVRQHLGKALFVAGEYREAATIFERCAAERRRRGDSDDLVESSVRAHHRAMELLANG